MAEFSTVIEAVSRQAGDFLYAFQEDLKVQEKGSDLDFVTNADLQSQALIRRLLKEAFPSHLFIGEEDGIPDKEIARRLYQDHDSYFWIVDPLDGTQNYIKHLGGYAVSMSLFHDGQTLVGCSYIPSEKELFLAVKGEGAYLNGKRLHVSDTATIRLSLLNTGIPTVNQEFRKTMVDIISRIAMDSLNMRIIGSAARSLGLTAEGSFEIYFELGPHPWDVGAGKLLVEEAGGKVTNFEGTPYRYGDDGVVATNGLIHEELMSYWRDNA